LKGKEKNGQSGDHGTICYGRKRDLKKALKERIQGGRERRGSITLKDGGVRNEREKVTLERPTTVLR